MFNNDSIISTIRWVLTGIGLVALIFGVGITACVTGFAAWNALASEAAVNHTASPDVIPFIVDAGFRLIATNGHTLAALIVGVSALSSAVLLTLAPRITAAFSSLYWAARVRREATQRAVYCASLNAAVTL